MSPHVLKVSAPTLCLHKLIMRSLSLQRVSVLGLVPVPKMPGSQTCGTDLLCHEDPGPHSVLLPVSSKRWGRHHPPAQLFLHPSAPADEHCAARVFKIFPVHSVRSARPSWMTRWQKCSPWLPLSCPGLLITWQDNKKREVHDSPTRHKDCVVTSKSACDTSDPVNIIALLYTALNDVYHADPRAALGPTDRNKKILGLRLKWWRSPRRNYKPAQIGRHGDAVAHRMRTQTQNSQTQRDELMEAALLLCRQSVNKLTKTKPK